MFSKNSELERGNSSNKRPHIVTRRITKKLETAALIEYVNQGAIVGQLNDLSKEIDVIFDHIMWRKILKKYKPFFNEWKSKKGLFQRSCKKKFADELARYREARDNLKAAYNHTGEKVPSLEELQAKKTALLQERSAKNAEYQEQKKFIKDVEFTRITLQEYLSNEASCGAAEKA